jgi:hypothetical protein
MAIEEAAVAQKKKIPVGKPEKHVSLQTKVAPRSHQQHPM